MSLSSIFQNLRSGKVKIWETIKNIFGSVSKRF